MTDTFPFQMAPEFVATAAALEKHGIDPSDVLQNSLHPEGYIAPLRDARGNRMANFVTQKLKVESRAWPSQEAADEIIATFIAEGGSLA